MLVNALYSVKAPPSLCRGRSVSVDCQVSDDKDSSMPSRSCQITKCFLEVSKSSTISEEKYLRKQLVIYDRQKHGPLQYEEAAKNKT